MSNCITFLIDTQDIKGMSTSDIFQKIVEEYQGTCNSLSEDDSDWLEGQDLFDELDQNIFECNCCGWWFEICEQAESDAGEYICNDCYIDEE